MAAEKQFETKIKKFLKNRGCWFLKYWGGAAFTKSGVPDLLVCCDGFFMGVELKAPNGRPSHLQIVNLRDIDKAGGYAILLYPKDFMLFSNLIQCIQARDTENAVLYYDLLKHNWKQYENKMNKGEDL